MKARTIERLDTLRYWTVVVQAVTLLNVFMSTIALCYILNWKETLFQTMLQEGLSNGFVIWGCISEMLFIASLFWYAIIECRIAQDKELRAALHNEMYLAYMHRAQQIALWVVMGTLLVFYFLENLRLNNIEELPAIGYGLIFYLGLTTLQTSWLIYNRRR